MRRERAAGYPWHAVLALLGDRWSLVIIRDIMVADRRRFQTLLSESEEGISTTLLANRLRKLVGCGLLVGTHESDQDETIFSLTERSIQLVPVMVQICAWGSKHCAASDELIGEATAVIAGGPRGQRAFMQELRRRHLGCSRNKPAATQTTSVMARPQTPRSSSIGTSRARIAPVSQALERSE